jgi:putative transposase
VPYFHFVFALPAVIGAMAYQNKANMYGLLFKAASDALITIAADRKHLGADIGVIAVLHTWGQTLQHHPHVWPRAAESRRTAGIGFHASPDSFFLFACSPACSGAYTSKV